MTLTLAAVYAPIAFTPGKTGRLFLEFALTLAGAVIVSGFVALTLTPMMSAKLLKHNREPGQLYTILERGFIAHGERLSPPARCHAARASARSAGSTWRRRPQRLFFLMTLKSELAPLEDRGMIRIRGTGPEGATIGLHGALRRADRRVSWQECRKCAAGWSISGSPEVSQSIVVAPLNDWSERTRSQQEISAELRPAASENCRHPGCRADAGAFGQRGSGRPIEFVIQTSGTYEDLQDYANAVIDRVRDNPALENIDTDLKLNTPELRVELDRAKVADLALDVSVVGRTLETLLGGRQVTRFEQNGEQYDVYVQLATR